MSHDPDSYDVAMRALRKKGIHESKVDFCPIERGYRNELVFRARVKRGNVAQWIQIPIWHAQKEDLGLIGFVFPDGTIRSDSEILCSDISGIHLPIFVAFWKPSVPLRERNFVADGRQSRLQEKPIILVT